MLRLGLCCLFRQAPIKFRSSTAKSLLRLPRDEQLARLDQLCLENSRALLAAVDEVRHLGIGAFRVLSPLFPLFTHPEVGYQLDQLASADEIRAILHEVKQRKTAARLRLSFHPDQFVLLSSPRPEVTESSLRELAYQAELAELIGADVINIHAGGVYGDKPAALRRLGKEIEKLPEAIRSRLTLENDDVSYSVADLRPFCADYAIPLVYDVHHHRCNPDGLSIAAATEICLESWQRVDREPYLHISSPKQGWDGNPKPHADFIDPADFPVEWLALDATLDVEAKAKEPAVLQLKEQLALPDWPGEGASHG
ncbi:UV-damage endonuclease [Malonomonas rubra DSM 5091]|uniref:UV-damage endonuclease n=1 Tax=Malonomonas rubra DSM 5091 TaxID=1122189 RepID=A0A1M6G300_MALRU|nr:UV DNA damage repair endonuclease UvsE [Malonomonas rubra]SHJ04262.1 UV-damage endonuclease [Malonomonas rubra DSM 5091]